MAKAANSGLCDDQLAAGEFWRDLAFLFRPFGFADRSVDRRDAAAFALVRRWALRRFVFVDARKFYPRRCLPKGQVLNSPLLVFDVRLT